MEQDIAISAKCLTPQGIHRGNRLFFSKIVFAMILQGCHFTLYCKEYSLFLAKWKITLYYSLFQALLFNFRKALYILFIFGVEVVNLR